ncbi:unnamed protein product [Musa acuminata subsp. malaccensis]|uniref:(wild Malaysian banana) hypothetical protein n=1 Tax=Musa acuminata subsp. malaccensis TaxID=214687 RepID=A0A804L6P8_MUSAM|nr:PREDICTED: uncharacterized protein LOC103971322 isoform X1 [Musa acuminata subsp. malaccensis]CAG1864285.1 unnamed protein product [Musa acuminata subsp. malaccensis]
MTNTEPLKLQDAGANDCWSLGSNPYPSDRFSKVSIGITINKFPMLASGAKIKDRLTVPACERIHSSQENIVKENKVPEVTETTKQNGKLTNKEQMASEKLSTRFKPHETPSSQRVHVFAEQTTVLDTEEGMLKNIAVVDAKVDQAGKAEKPSAWFSRKPLLHETPTAEKFLFFVNQASVLQSQDGVHKETDSLACGKRLEKDENTERAVAFATMQKMQMLQKGVGYEQPDEVTTDNNGALKKKIWEILGMASESKQNMNLPNSEDKEAYHGKQFGMAPKSNHTMDSSTPGDKMTLSRNQRGEFLKEKSVKPKQNPDAIETHLESPKEIIRGPITHYFTRKRASCRTFQKLHRGNLYPKIPLSASSTESKPKLEDKNIFAFDQEEAKAVTSGRYVSGHPNISKRKRSEQKNKRIKFRAAPLPKKLVSDKTLKSNEKEQTVLSSVKVTSRRQETRSSPCLVFQHDKDQLQTSNQVPILNHHLQLGANKHLAMPPVLSSAETEEHSGSLKRKRNSWKHDKSQVPNDVNLEKEIDHPSVEKTSIPLVDFQCPSFAKDANPPPQLCKLLNEDLCTPVANWRKIPSRTSSRPQILENHKQETDNSNSDTVSTDETIEIHESENVMLPHDAEGKETEKQPSLSPRKNQRYKSFEASDFINEDYRSSEEWFLNSGSLPESPVGIHRMKRVNYLKDTKISKSSLSSPPHVGTSRIEEATGLHEILEHYPEDELARSVCQLVRLLEKFKSKIRSQICKKSSKILLDAGEKVHLQLQHAESQMEADLGKFLGIGKSKGKCLESKFQEQQERLRFMHNKFKEEVDQHLLGCRSTLEEIEAYKIELKGSLDRQKASHRKLLLQVEGAIESQISDAETRVATLHKEADRKINGLKHVLKEWLLEGTVN